MKSICNAESVVATKRHLVSARALRLCALCVKIKTRNAAQLCYDLAKTFAAPREQIAKDVTAMLQDLADKGMVAV